MWNWNTQRRYQYSVASVLESRQEQKLVKVKKATEVIDSVGGTGRSDRKDQITNERQHEGCITATRGLSFSHSSRRTTRDL